MSGQIAGVEDDMPHVLGAALTSEGLRRLREEVCGMSRRDFSRRTGVPERSLARYETGQAPPPPWLGLVLAAVIHDLPAYRGRALNAADQIYRLRTLPPQPRLAFLGACLTAAANLPAMPLAEALEALEGEADQLRAVAGALRAFAELAEEERLPWPLGEEAPPEEEGEEG